jgi:hypothetical protein
MPNWSEDEFARKMVLSILPDIKKWMKDTLVTDETIISDIEDAINDTFDRDGYGLAKFLENHRFWTGVDTRLVNILDKIGRNS